MNDNGYRSIGNLSALFLMPDCWVFNDGRTKTFIPEVTCHGVSLPLCVFSNVINYEFRLFAVTCNVTSPSYGDGYLNR